MVNILTDIANADFAYWEIGDIDKNDVDDIVFGFGEDEKLTFIALDSDQDTDFSKAINETLFYTEIDLDAFDAEFALYADNYSGIIFALYDTDNDRKIDRVRLDTTKDDDLKAETEFALDKKTGKFKRVYIDLTKDNRMLLDPATLGKENQELYSKDFIKEAIELLCDSFIDC